MPRDGSNIYHRPPGTDGTPNYTVESARYNAFTADVEQDLNLPRPIIAGGTGASSAPAALAAMGGEQAKQVIVNYNSDVFAAGSFYSATSATGAPVTGHAFAGVCYFADATNLVIEARDLTDTAHLRYTRIMSAGVWGAFAVSAGIFVSDTPPASASPNSFWWESDTGNLYIRYDDGDSVQWVMAVPTPDPGTFILKAGDTMTGLLTLSGDPTTAMQAVTKQYVDNAAVRYDIAQTLTATQKNQAQANITLAPTITQILSGAGTYTTKPGTTWLRVRMVGGGSAGASGAANPQPGTAGTNTTFGLHTANGAPIGVSPYAGCPGGGGTIGAGGFGLVVPGGGGGPSSAQTAANQTVGGANGGSSMLGGGAQATAYNLNGAAAVANSGGGGAGGSSGNVINNSSGGGGGGGGGLDIIIPAPAASYAYSVGPGGIGSLSGSSAGGNGGSGQILIEEHYGA